MQRAERRITTIAGAGVIALLLTGCGDSGSTSDNSHGEKPKKANAASVATPLKLDTAVRQAKYTDSGQKTFDLKVAPASLKRGTVADLANVRLDDDLKGMVPYYLTVSVTNPATAAVDGGAAADRFGLALASGNRGQSVSFFSGGLGTSDVGPLETCIGTKATNKLPAGATARQCQVVMVPKEGKPAAVAYKDASGTLTWQVDGGDTGNSRFLPAGQSAKATWTDTYGKDFPLTVTPKSVRKVGPEALAGYNLSADQKNADLYFVTFAYRNGAQANLYPSMDNAVDLRTGAGQGVQKMTLIAIGSNGPKGCESSAPDGMVQPGKTVQQCGVYLVAKGDKPVAVTFTPTSKGAQPLIWKAS